MTHNHASMVKSTILVSECRDVMTLFRIGDLVETAREIEGAEEFVASKFV